MLNKKTEFVDVPIKFTNKLTMTRLEVTTGFSPVYGYYSLGWVYFNGKEFSQLSYKYALMIVKYSTEDRYKIGYEKENGHTKKFKSKHLKSIRKNIRTCVVEIERIYCS